MTQIYTMMSMLGKKENFFAILSLSASLDGYAQTSPFNSPHFLLFPLSSFSMASQLSSQILQLSCYSQSVGLDSRGRATANASHPLCFDAKDQGIYGLPKKNSTVGYFSRYYTSSRWISSRVLSSMASSTHSGQTSWENGAPVAKFQSREMEFNRVNCLVWVLHESARSFSHAVENLRLSGTGPALAMAWVGKDVHDWHKRIAYQVVVYVLMKMAVEVEILLSSDRHNDTSPVREILSPKVNLVGEHIESQLSMRQSGLEEWFKEVELPRIAGFFLPLLKSWSMEYAGSGVAGIIVAISCCAAIGKLGSKCTCCPLFTLSIEDVLVQLMDLSHSLVSVDKLHHLATEAGFELDFLTHFGTKVFSGNTSEELEFWIGLAQKKLSVAFHKDNAFSGRQIFHDKVQADSLATLGLFAYLGKRTRIFLSGMGINDLDDHIKDFLSYLECGSLFIFPELSSILVYQLFMEVVTDEIGWLDFYASFACIGNQERRRSKHCTIQAEKEIILTTVFTVCYDVFSGFAHFSRSTLKPLDADLLEFLLRSQSLLTICLEDYWAAYDKSGELIKFSETVASDPTSFARSKGTIKFSIVSEAQQNSRNFMAHECPENSSQHGSGQKMQATRLARISTTTFVEGTPATKSIPRHESLIRKYSVKLASTSSDIWMGTQLLFTDFMVALELLLNQLRGHRVTERETKKLKRTLNDIASLIPVTILMLLPVSAIGHAAMLAAIKKYMPYLIPSPYSSERLDVMKQLKRTKKMEVQSWSTLEDTSSKIS
ncbi:hypothetical protein F2P56_028049 [Juglans regia]|uniref:Letm1 RBD domain-containing protein n=2 Tax=Juglans regia TaxID=51240 RepID=A0A833WZL6_JUGRE|nr:uncharacterized protein LOC109007849 isoform X2 [Juglans regia]KAF5453112.1 hypothetical protein F2P56_028049 [Juglans regia]